MRPIVTDVARCVVCLCVGRPGAGVGVGEGRGRSRYVTREAHAICIQSLCCWGVLQVGPSLVDGSALATNCTRTTDSYSSSCDVVPK